MGYEIAELKTQPGTYYVIYNNTTDKVSNEHPYFFVRVQAETYLDKVIGTPIESYFAEYDNVDNESWIEITNKILDDSGLDWLKRD